MKIGNIDEKLKGVPEDPAVKIRHATIVEGEKNNYYVAEINKQVQAHVHFEGDEFYHVLEGNGLMHIGNVELKDGKVTRTSWEKPVKVKRNDVFIIPCGYAHSLKNAGGKLVIAFICPTSHMSNDRIILENP